MENGLQRRLVASVSIDLRRMTVTPVKGLMSVGMGVVIRAVVETGGVMNPLLTRIVMYPLGLLATMLRLTNRLRAR